MSEILGLVKLNEKLREPEHQEWFLGVFPKQTPHHMRFSLNFFTSIGLGGLTDSTREALEAIQQEQAKKKLLEKQQEEDTSSDSTEDDSSESSED